ncbi:MAG: RecX family transcriptional regulator [Myxococcota bacterium]
MARGPRRITPKYLERAAFYYLSRRGASRAQLRDVLLRKVRRAEDPPAESAEWVEAVLVRCEELGYINDRSYAASKARSMRRRGGSKAKIRAKLRQKGIAGELIDETFEAEGQDDELSAARRYAERRRFGRNRERRDKELASLGRAGFSFQVARRALEELGAANEEADR